MLAVAKKYPLFVLPLARDIVGDLPEGIEKGAKGAVEMHFLVRACRRFDLADAV